MAATRKTVTIVFSDLAGSTSLGEQLDPEALRRVMERYFTEMRAVLERHGGTVEKFIGDAVMAVFGVPTAHEDDALRAVKASAEMRERLVELNHELERERGMGLVVRTGVNTGEVVAGDPTGGQFYATGDAVNVAARLEQAAQPGDILLGEQTYRLVRNAVRADELEPLPVKGKADDVVAFRLLQVIEGAPSLARRFDTPFVGRENELAHLLASFERSVAERAPALVTVLGPAGIGKTRLAAELTVEIEDRARVLRGRCLSYGEGITFWPLEEMLGSLGERPRDAPDPEDARSTEESFWAYRKLFEALARERPHVLVLEDIHWAEQTLLDLIEHLVEWTRNASIMVLCLARPELLEERSDWPGERIELGPLPDAEAETLVDVLAAGVDAGVRRRALTVAEGNPLFLEQMVTLAADEKDEIAVPQTIHALLTARLDRLEPEERNLLEAAAIVGKEFWRGALLRLCPANTEVSALLQRLVRRRLVHPEASSVPGEDAFSFAHILIREAAYAAISKETRANLHERFADWLAETGNPHEEIIGYHLEQAYRLRTQLVPSNLQAGGVANRAAGCLLRAARRASLRGDDRAAANLLDRTIALVPDGDPRRREALLALGRALFELGAYERADTVLTEVAQRARVARDTSLEWKALLERSEVRTLTDPEGQADEAHRNVEQAVEMFADSGDDEGLCRAWRLEAAVQHTWSQEEATLAAAQRALTHARRAADEREEALSRAWICSAVKHGPTPTDEAILELEAHLEWARSGGRRGLEALILGMLANVHAICGRFAEARFLAGARRAIVEDLGLGGHLPHVFWTEGIIEEVAGNLGVAEERFRRALEGFEKLGERSFLSTLAAELGDVLYLQERLAEAEELACLSETLAASDDVTSQVAWRDVRAKVLARRGAFAQADTLARESAARAATTDFPLLHAGSLADLAEVLRLTGRTNDAEAALHRAVRLYEKKGSIFLADRAQARFEVELQVWSPSA